MSNRSKNSMLGSERRNTNLYDCCCATCYDFEHDKTFVPHKYCSRAGSHAILPVQRRLGCRPPSCRKIYLLDPKSTSPLSMQTDSIYNPPSHGNPPHFRQPNATSNKANTALETHTLSTPVVSVMRITSIFDK
eukprot:3669466-Amphidinium_carterae.1